MDYLELKCPATGNTELQEIVIAELAEAGFESFVEESDYLLAYIPNKLFSIDMLSTVASLRTAIENNEVVWKTIEDQNWNEVWERNYPSVTIDDRCHIRADFHDQSDFEFDILIKPKMAFGTAHHETTALMLKQLLDKDVSGERILDMGCGTAVLAILASMKGALSVDAIDNDEWAYNNSLENIQLNHRENVQVSMGDASLLDPKSSYHTILANINKNILLADIKAYTAVLLEGGSIFFSGFYEEDLDDIRKEANANNLTYVSHLIKNNWCCAHFVKQ